MTTQLITLLALLTWLCSALGAPQSKPLIARSASIVSTTSAPTVEPASLNLNDSLVESYMLEALNVSVVNATAAEITFVLPLFAVFRPAYAHVAYTGLPIRELSSGANLDNEPPVEAQWQHRHFTGPGGRFVQPFMSYLLTPLKPDFKYWVDFSIVFVNNTEVPFNKPLDLELQSIVMPPLTPIKLRPKTIQSESSLASTTTTSAPIEEPPTETVTVSVIETTSSISGSIASSSTTPEPSTTTTTTSEPSSTTSSTTTTTTTTTTSEQPTSTKASLPTTTEVELLNQNRLCPDSYDTNRIDGAGMSLPWVDVQLPLNAPIQKYAWHLLIALSVMTALFTIVSYLYLRKSTRIIAPISNKKPMDPTIAKLVSYYAILVDENNQNYANDAILAKQKTLELEQSSPPPFIINR